MKLRYLFSLVLVFCFLVPVYGENVIAVAEEKEWVRMELLAEFLHTYGGFEMEIIDQPDFPKDLSPYTAAIMYVHGRFDPAIEKALISFAKKGKRLIVLHHGISSAKRKNEEWLPFLGVHLAPDDDPKFPYKWIHDVDFHLVNLQPNHYITSNKVTYPKTVHYRSSDLPSVKIPFPAIEFKNSEIFLNYQFTDGREKNVLFGFLFEHPATGKIYMQDRAGWYKPAGKGWVFSFQPGHATSDFEKRNFCQIMMNCLTWQPCP